MADHDERHLDSDHFEDGDSKMAGKPGSKPGVIRTIILECKSCGTSYQALGKNRPDGPHPRFYCSVQCRHAGLTDTLDGPLTSERLHELLQYDPTQSAAFIWRVRHGKMLAGTVAGWVGKDRPYRHRVITIDYKRYQTARLAHFYVTGEWPPAEMDHENCTAADDRWSNIRPATRSQNSCNTHTRSDNTSGFKGVSFHIRDNKYQAYGHVDGRQISLGYFDTAEEAHAAYLKFAKRQYGKFARAK